MRGFGGLTEAIDSLLVSMGLSLPPWAFPALLAMGFAALFPHIRQNQRTHSARQLIRERSESGGSGSAAFESELLALANGHPTTLTVIVTEAHKYGLLGLAKNALAVLQQAGGNNTDIHRLRLLLYGPPPVHPEAEYAVVEKLLAQGLHSLASTRIQKALQHWPNDEQLHRLQAQASSEE